MTAPSFPVTGDPEADALLVSDPFALLLGMLLDQQVPMEWAFRSPWRLRERIGDRFSPTGIAAYDPDEFKAVFSEVPALHRFPGSMAKRVQALSQHLVDTYDGDTERLWNEARTGDELFRRLRELPGFGEEKARIFVALLAKRFGVRPTGLEARGRSLRRQPAPLGRRHQLAGRVREGAGLEEGPEGQGARQGRLTRGGACRGATAAGGRASRAAPRWPGGRGAASGPLRR